MKVALARGPGRHGGIFRRFRALADYCQGRHDAVGIQIFGDVDGTVPDPIRTLAFSSRALPVDLMRAETAGEVLEALGPLVERVAAALAVERCDRVLAVDTDLKGLTMVAACRRLAVPVTTFVASVARHDAGYEGRAAARYMPDVERYCLEESDRLIFPSHLAMHECRGHAPRMAPARVIHNGIAAAFLEAPDGPRDRSLVGAVMRLSAIKNPVALGRIADRLAAHGVRVELVTDATKARRPALVQVGGVHLRPPPPDDVTLAAFLAGCRAVVCPSRFEASGNVPMEAIATGTPAVVTDRMGTAEVFQELGLDDLIVAVDDIEATVDRLLNAAPVEARVRDRLRREFAWPAVCERLLSALQG